MILVLTTSFPRHAQDDAGIFVQRLVEAIAQQSQEQLQVLVPQDAQEPAQELLCAGKICVQRFHYTLFAKPRLCFGAGILSNIGARPWVALQIAGLLFGFALRALKVSPRPRILYVNWAACALPAYLVHWVTGIPFVVSLRGQDIHLVRARILRPLWNFVLGRAQAVVSVSEEFRQSVQHALPKLTPRLQCIPSGVEAVLVDAQEALAAREKYAIPSSHRLLISVGRVIPLKRIEVLLEALPALPEFCLLVVGREQSAEYLSLLKERALTLGIQERVFFLGGLAPAEIPKLLAAATYFVSASSSEGRPNAVLEAFVQGVPAILSRIEAHSEVSQQGSLASLFELDKPDALVKALLECELSPAACKQRSQRARASMLEWSWEKAAQKYLEVFALKTS
jgi:teichuronic acid biosynthesis glycosyltransferase TuaC